MTIPLNDLPLRRNLPPGRCTGHCCEEFHLPQDPDAIKAAVADNRAAGTPDTKAWEQIADMVIYLGPRPKPKNPDGQQFHRYTCRHFDKENRVCLIYQTRPTMCQNHGTAYPCDMTGCPMVNAKRDPGLAMAIPNAAQRTPGPVDVPTQESPPPSDAALE